MVLYFAKFTLPVLSNNNNNVSSLSMSSMNIFSFEKTYLSIIDT